MLAQRGAGSDASDPAVEMRVSVHRCTSTRRRGRTFVHPRGNMQSAYIPLYYGCMASLLQIRNVPDAVRRELKARAAAHGQSLNAYLLDLIGREVARPTVAEVLQRAAQRAERATGSAVDVIDVARADRDEQLIRRRA